jgi:hypothetical protein
LDREALREYRKRLAELDEALEEAQARDDLPRHDKLSAEREALLREVARATGLGGKARCTGSPAEEARLNVTRTIRHAITYLETAFPELATHLDESVLTGVSCSYEPRRNVELRFSLSPLRRETLAFTQRARRHPKNAPRELRSRWRRR